jgi:hypothetical protein
MIIPPFRPRGAYCAADGSWAMACGEIFKSSTYADLSLNQWLALTPPELLKAHLNLDKQVTGALRKMKAPIVPA